MPRILVCDPLAPEGLAALQAAPGVTCVVKLKMPKEELLACVGDYDALIVRSETKVTAEVLEAGRRLKVVGRAGAGLDNIDVKAAEGKGVQVVNVPDATSVAVAELTVAMLLLLARPILAAHRHVGEGGWERAKFSGSELQGKTLGIVGLGRIGTAVADRAHALGMTLIAHTRPADPEHAAVHHVALRDWPAILGEADYLTLHTPLGAETKGLIGPAEFALMRRGVKIVNCARGGILDERALLQALEEGRVEGVALDVYEAEPPVRGPLLGMAQVIHTPHIGASTAESQRRAGLGIAQKVLSTLRAPA